MSLNKAQLIGNLGRDIELRETNNGNAVVNLSVATNERWTDRESGELQEKTEWHYVVFFGRKAEVCAEYLRKGSKVYVEGRLQTRKYDDKEGVERYVTEIVGYDVQFLDAKENGNGNGNRPPEQGKPKTASKQAKRKPVAKKAAAPPEDDFEDFEDDIPF